MKRRYQSKIMRVGGYGSIGLLGILTTAMLFPIVNNQSYATCLNGDDECYTTMSTTEVGVTASTAISLAMSPSVRMEVVPTSTGATSSASTKLAVSTNSKDGYALYMQTGNSTGDLLSTSTTNTASKISNTTLTNASLEGLEKNTYGYAISTTAPDSNTKYSTLPTRGGVIQKTDSTTGSNGDNYIYGDSYYLAFGTKIGTDLEAGSYTGTVTVSAVANPKTLASMFDLTYMQEMTSDICTNTREGYTKQLVDTRDGKSYWVAKLKDGNCWMTQNLAFTITQEMIDSGSINGSNTDIEGAWDNNSANPPRPTEISTSKHTINEYQRSWNIGDYVISMPKTYNVCATDAGAYNNLPMDTKIDQLCPMSVVDVSGTDWSPTYTAQETTISNASYVQKTIQTTSGTSTVIYVPITEAESRDADRDANGNFIPFSYTGLVAVDFNNHTYDPHYLFGNYYQWSTAVAGNTDIATYTSSDVSICPKNWTLPSTNKDSDGKPLTEVNKSFWKLYNSLGYRYASITVDRYKNPMIPFTINYDPQYPFGAPLQYVRNGYISKADDNLVINGIGHTTQITSSVKNGSNSGNNVILHSIYFTLTYIYANTWDGMIIRCVAK